MRGPRDTTKARRNAFCFKIRRKVDEKSQRTENYQEKCIHMDLLGSSSFALIVITLNARRTSGRLVLALIPHRSVVVGRHVLRTFRDVERQAKRAPQTVVDDEAADFTIDAR